MALFTAAHAAKQVAKTANLEAKYYAMLSEAKNYYFKPNGTLIRVVNSMERLINNALKHGSDIKKLYSEGYFDNTLNEYKSQSKKETLEETEKWINNKRTQVEQLRPLGKDLAPLIQYCDNLYKDLVLPMQAFERLLELNFGSKTKFKGQSLISGTFGSEFKSDALHEYQRGKLINSAKSAYKALVQNQEGTEKYKNALANLAHAKNELDKLSYAIELRHSVDLQGRLIVDTKVRQKALPKAQQVQVESI